MHQPHDDPANRAAQNAAKVVKHTTRAIRGGIQQDLVRSMTTASVVSGVALTSMSLVAAPAVAVVGLLALIGGAVIATQKSES